MNKLFPLFYFPQYIGVGLLISSLVDNPRRETDHIAIVFSRIKNHICAEFVFFPFMVLVMKKGRNKNLNEVTLKLTCQGKCYSGYDGNFRSPIACKFATTPLKLTYLG